MTQDPTTDHTTSAPVCYRHPERHTLLTCSRCERPICASCSTDASVGQRCPECLRSEGTQKVIPTGPRRSASAGAPATMTFIALAVGFYFLSRMPSSGFDLFTAFQQSNQAVSAGEWWRIFTPILLHASLMHIMFNMWALWVLGPQIERGVGTLPFVGLYLASAGVGGMFFFYSGAVSPAVGASGAIFGLFGIWLNWAYHRRHTASGGAMLRQIGFLLLINAAIPLLIPGIAWQAHLGGLIAGFVIGEVWSRIRGPNTTRLRALVAFGVVVLAAFAALL